MRRPLAALAAALLVAAPAGAQQTLAGFMTANGYSAVPLTKLRTGHQAVAVTLNGVAATFVLDSGANATVINTASLPKFGIKPADQIGAGGGFGAGGLVQVGLYPIRTLRVGDRDVPLTRVHAIDLATFATAFKLSSAADIDGIIGQDVLSRFGGVIDVANGTLFLRLPAR